MPSHPSLDELARKLSAGEATSRSLVEECLARIDDPAGEGTRAFVHVNREHALRAADAMDALRVAGYVPSRFAGIPVSIKDLFDVAGEETRAGSRALVGTGPAKADAASVARLRHAGFILIGRTNMTEFAYSGLGLNPHYGTPLGAWDRGNQRIPGGSSSGAAVSVADGMAHAALGTDTGGSCRIPAACNELVGFKPTAGRVPEHGTIPLSPSLDSVGPIGRTVRCCMALDAILSGQPERNLEDTPISGLRLGVLKTIAPDGMDRDVATRFDEVLSILSRAGALIHDISVPEFGDVAAMSVQGGFTAAESYAWHRDLIARRRADYDPRVLIRIERGAQQSAAHYIDNIDRRRALIASVKARFAPFDAVLMPTIPVIPPTIAECSTQEGYNRLNLLLLRNSTLINMMDGCAISISVNAPEEPPVGLMLASSANRDSTLLAAAETVASLLAR